MSNTFNTQLGAISASQSVIEEDTTKRTSSEILGAQHLRLLIYLLPAKSTSEFAAWLQRAPVLSAWAEFTAALPGPQPDPDLSVVEGMVRAAIDEVTLPHARFRMLHPDKRDWNAVDHHVRFIVAVISDSLLEEHWDKKEWKNQSIKIVQAVYEVLVYMKAVQFTQDDENVE